MRDLTRADRDPVEQGGFRRGAGRGDGRDVGEEAGVAKKAGEAPGLGNEGADLHRAGAAGAGLDVDAKDAREKFGPRDAAAAAGLVGIGLHADFDLGGELSDLGDGLAVVEPEQPLRGASLRVTPAEEFCCYRDTAELKELAPTVALVLTESQVPALGEVGDEWLVVPFVAQLCEQTRELL